MKLTYINNFLLILLHNIYYNILKYYLPFFIIFYDLRNYIQYIYYIICKINNYNKLIQAQ